MPYAKQKIKEALISALKLTDNPQMKEHLKLGYIQLADWQEGVGESDQGIDLTNVDLSQNTEALAKAVLEQSSGARDWGPVVQKEQENLQHELQELGLW